MLLTWYQNWERYNLKKGQRTKDRINWKAQQIYITINKDKNLFLKQL